MTTPVRLGPRFLDAADEAITLNVRGLAAVALQLLGTWVGTVSFEATVDGDTWVAINMFPPDSTTAATTATANGVFLGHCAGLEAVRARFSTRTSGTVRAFMQGADSPGRF